MPKTELEPDDIVTQVVKGFSNSWDYTSSSWHRLWEDHTKLYNSERVYVGYNGISDTFVPLSYSTIETMVSATSGEKPLVEYIPTNPSQQTNTEVLNGLFSFYWDLDSWTNKFIQYNRCLFKLGTSVIYTYWNIDHPCADIIPLRDFFIDPTATILNYQNAAYMGYRFLASKKALEDELVVNPDYDENDKKSKQLVPKYKNLDKLEGHWEGGEQTDKEYKDTHMGSTLAGDAIKDQVEVICYFTKEKKYYVGNREQVIYEGPNDFKQRQEFLGVENPTGMYPFIIDANAPDESMLYGRSILQPIAKPQELLNDITNQNIDAVSWALDPVMELDPKYSTYIDKIQNVTGAVYPFVPGSYQAVQKPTIPSNAFSERTNIKNEIREATAVDQVIQGAASTGETTATEVKAQVASAGRRFNLILSSLENGGYYQFAKLIFQMVQMYVTAPTMYRVIGKEGVDWQTFDPEMFKGDYEPRIKLQATLDAEKTKKMRDLKEMYTAMLGSPFVEQDQLTRLVVKKAFNLEPDEVDSLVVPKDQAMQQATEAGEKQQKPEKTPEQIALEGIAKSYGDDGTAPDVKAQLEQMAGLEHSAVHEGKMENVASEQFMNDVVNTQTAMPGPGSPPGMAPVAPQPVETGVNGG